MKPKLADLAKTIPFAHLLGIKAGRAESDDEKDDDEKKDDEDAKSESDDDKPSDEEKDKKDSKAEGDDEKKKDDEKEDDDKAQASATPAASAAQLERNRCARIVAHGIKAGALRQACAYAFDTDMSVETAVATIDSTADDRKASAGSLYQRMGAEQQPVVKAAGGLAEGAQLTDGQRAAQFALDAVAKARGEKTKQRG